MAIHKASKGKRNTLLGERMQLYYKALTHTESLSESGTEGKMKKAS